MGVGGAMLARPSGFSYVLPTMWLGPTLSCVRASSSPSPWPGSTGCKCTQHARITRCYWNNLS